MGVTRPLFICQPHGAGDRAISFEPRFRRFNRVLVAGPKTARRMVESGVTPERVRDVGYAKAEYLAAKARAKPRPFANDRPIILYNPHFRTALSSLAQAPDIVRDITRNTDLNLIVAPHIRAFESASAEILARWQSLAVPDRVLVDTGSPRMIDMSHVAVADLYLGDVSSQIYEFLLLNPRPCVFVNAHGVEWEQDSDYAFWQLGEVVEPNAVVPGLMAALAAPNRFAAVQQAAVADTFGPLEGSAERAASAILASFGEPR
jgi:CDP-glycerol glycerophosphotransferase (TagB/SpsB family)